MGSIRLILSCKDAMMLGCYDARMLCGPDGQMNI